MKDMSRAFDTVNRKMLMEDLRLILEADELHILRLLLEDVSLVVRCGSQYGENFITTIGTPQGDCLSPILFTLYLANALKDVKQKPEHDHVYSVIHHEKPEHEEHPYSKMNHSNTTKKEEETTFTSIDLQYADDINYITQNYAKIQEMKKMIPPKLEARDLITNPSKDEEFKVQHKKYDSSECVNCSRCRRCLKCKQCKECPYCKDWKKCKMLGSMIDTDSDIKRRKSLALGAMRKLDHLWKNSRTPIRTKLKIFNALVGSIFLYNSYLWAMNETRNGIVNAFQRRLLRHMLNIKWPNKISTEKLMNMTKVTPWSNVIDARRLSWFGHMIRLPESTPVKIALREAQIEVKQPRGRPRTTWLSCMKKQLKDCLNLSWVQAIELAKDRAGWRERIYRVGGPNVDKSTE